MERHGPWRLTLAITLHGGLADGLYLHIACHAKRFRDWNAQHHCDLIEDLQTILAVKTGS
jgi:hypothetical protein